MKDPCEKCGFLNEYGYCQCSDIERWYACPIENKKPENIKALEELGKQRKEREERRMKKVVCAISGTIYYATILKDGLMGNDRKEITNDCIDAVIEHIAAVTDYEKEGCGGYDIKSKKDGKCVKLILFNDDEFELKRKERKEE